MKLHPKTAALVDRFAAALKEKLAAAEEKYGYSDGWATDDWMGECRKELRKHVAKGDPLDVAPRWPGQIPPPLATPNSPRQDRRIMTTRVRRRCVRRPP